MLFLENDYVYTPLRKYVNDGSQVLLETGGYLGFAIGLSDIFMRIGKTFNPDGNIYMVGCGLNSNSININYPVFLGL